MKEVRLRLDSQLQSIKNQIRTQQKIYKSLSNQVQKKKIDNVFLVWYFGTKGGDLLVDYAIKGIDDKLWERARIKAIRQKVRMSYVLRRLIEMWVKGEIEIDKDKSRT